MIGAAGIALLILLHIFFRYVGSAPPLSFDESLANVAFTLADLGRYGFLTAPIMGDSGIRTTEFYTYGPFYFYFSGFLSWLFGNSIILLRAIHPGLLVFICLLAFFSFRRYSLAAAGAFTLGVFVLFTKAQWPMIRPDIMVSALAFPGIALAGIAIRDDRPVAWFFSALFVAAASLAHPIAWPLGPALVIVWLVWFVCRHKTFNIWRRLNHLEVVSFAAAGAGACVAGFVFFYAIGSKFGEFIEFATRYQGSIDTGRFAQYWNSLLTHFLMAWSGCLRCFLMAGLLASGLALGGLLILSIPKLAKDTRRVVIGLVVPPMTLWLSYQLILGFFPQFHSGYGIFASLGAIWTASAAVAAAFTLLKARNRLLAKRLEIVVALVVVAGLIQQPLAALQKPVHWQRYADSAANIQDYLAHVLDPLPRRARTWGYAGFGAESGTRIDLIQHGEAYTLYSSLSPELKAQAKPDYFVLSSYDLYGWTLGFLNTLTRIENNPKGSSTFMYAMEQTFPEKDFSLVNLVHAPPYGSARVYQVVNAGSVDRRPPTLAINDGKSRQWAYTTGTPAKVDPVAETAVNFHYVVQGKSLKATARRTVSFYLPRGTYSLSLQPARKNNSANSGFFMASPNQNHYLSSRHEEVASGFVPYFSNETSVVMILEHAGGKIFLSQFDTAPGATFSLLSARPVTPLKTVSAPQSGGRKLELPPMNAWRPVLGDDSRVISVNDDSIDMVSAGTSGKYNLLSPPVRIPSGSRIRLTLPIEVRRGAVAVGILDDDRNWILEPVSPWKPIEFLSQNGENIQIVVKDDNPRNAEYGVALRVSRGFMGVTPLTVRPQYVDQISKCFGKNALANPAHCR